MTTPYRLRDAFGDWKSASYLFGMLGSAVCLGVTPVIVEDYSLGAALMLVWVTAWTGILLLNMHTTDRRLREVNSS